MLRNGLGLTCLCTVILLICMVCLTTYSNEFSDVKCVPAIPQDRHELTSPSVKALQHDGVVHAGILLSYPRSGNHLTRTLIEFLTQRPTGSYYNSKEDKMSIVERAGQSAAFFGVNPKSGNIAVKLHSWLDQPLRSHFLILIIRDPFESLTSELKDTFSVYKFYKWATGESLWSEAKDHYLSLLEAFNRYTHPKLLLYYEDFHQDPASYVTPLGEFLGASPERIRQCVDKIADIEAVASGALNRPGVSSGDIHHYAKRNPFHSSVPVPSKYWDVLGNYDTVCQQAEDEDEDDDDEDAI